MSSSTPLRVGSGDDASDNGRVPSAPPGTVRGRRFRPKLHYELIGCGIGGHQLLGTDVDVVTDEDRLVVWELGDGLRWHRCLRCDSWLPMPRPTHPTAERLPARAEIQLPLRGRPLRDRYVLRLIALDRVLHFLVLGVLAAAVFLFAARRSALSDTFYRILDALQGGVGGPNGQSGSGLLDELQKAFTAESSSLLLIGLVLAAYAVLEGVEAIGLWRGKRWAEYLTFVATAALMIPEIYELTGTVTPTKIVTLVINLAVVVYLLFAKRLFGLRGGAAAEQAEHERDTGWGALERAFRGPPRSTEPAAASPSP